MIEYAKKNPGLIKAGVSSVGTTDYLAFAELEMKYGIKLNIIPQGGGGPLRVAILGGHIDIAALTATEGGPLVTAGQLKSFGIMDSKRFSQFPDMKTCAEQGVSIEGGTEDYVVVPKNTPPEIIQTLQDAFKKVTEDKAFLEMATKLNIGVDYLDAKAAKERLDKFRFNYKDLIEKLGIGK
jgi:tripartite-type tricarboxylate transporter receptor subunit TctC